MSLSFCFSSSELTCQCTKMMCLARLNSPPLDHVVRIKCADGKGNIKESNRGARKLLLSSQWIPEHGHGSLMVKKRTQEPNKKLEFVRTLLIDNYDSYTYNIYQELSLINGVPPVVIRNDDWTWEDFCRHLYEEKAFDNIVISPGPGSPTCPDDIGICLRVLLECKDIPILGVCLGHQALGYVHGAKVIHASEPIHGRLSEIEHNGCKLFNGIPTGRNSGFKVVRYHSLIIDFESLPKEVIPISWTSSTDVLPFLMSRKSSLANAHESRTRTEGSGDDLFKQLEISNSWPLSPFKLTENRSILMGIMHSTRPHYGVQFHPESVGTLHGRQIFQNFRKITEEYWMRLRQSITEIENVHYAACMQASDAGRLFNELSRSETGMGNVDNKLCKELFRGRNAEHKADKSDWFHMLDNATMSYASSVKFLKLRWKKFDSLASQLGGATKIFCELFGHQHAEDTFWLDSSSTEKGRARFSFMGGKGGSLWKQMTYRISHKSGLSSKGGGYLTVEDAKGYTQITFLEEGFLNFLNKELQSFRYDKGDYEGLPFDFQGGYVGYLGYGLKVECSDSINQHKSKTPDACFFFADNLLVIDHLNDGVYIMSLLDSCTTVTPWLDDTEQKLLGLKASPMNKLGEQMLRNTDFSQSKGGFNADKSRDQYMSDVKKCQKYIRDGESYELCLTTQIRKTIGEIDSLRLYLQLRDRNPAPYACWLNFSKENLCICCSSPERFLRLDKDDILEAKPIKGTVARGTTMEEDERLKLQLQFSEKDQAENLMIVDLLRNDLGRVCEPGSVHVPHLMDVESYATVHTMVSTIRGKKRSNISPVDCVRAAFPGGSMTGAPKLRSMEILDSIESCPRGIYSGCIGYFSYNKTFDLNIVIRTVVLHEGEASIGAGGAIIALSNPADEYEEMSLKTGAPAMAVMEFS